MNLFAPIANLGPTRDVGRARKVFPFSTTPPALAAVVGVHFDIVNPWRMSLQDWADAFVLAMAHVLPLPQLHEDSQFERWAQQIVSEPILQTYQLPEALVPWQDWADRVNATLASTGAL